MIIGISGKIGSGKDTVGQIIQYLISMSKVNSQPSWTWDCHVDISGWEIKRWAGKVKEICSILTGIPVEDFEKQEVKDRVLGEEWTRYGYADGFMRTMDGTPIMNNKQCSKECYEEELRTNWQTAYKHEYTVREILQLIGTNAMRHVIHEDVWVNALMSEYKNKWGDLNIARELNDEVPGNEYPNWIITDTRFPNEAKAIKDRDGLLIRVNRESQADRFAKIDTDGFHTYEHPSETSLDNYQFDEYIDNNGSIEELIEKVKLILIKHKLI